MYSQLGLRYRANTIDTVVNPRPPPQFYLFPLFTEENANLNSVLFIPMD